jgi:hypothetical protein
VSARYRVIFEAPSECPPKADFLARINERIGTAWRASPHRSAGVLAVSVAKSGDLFEAHLTLVDLWGRAAIRELEGETCEDVLANLAVAAVSAIESRLGPQPPYWEVSVTSGLDWRTGLMAWGAGATGALRWPTSRRSIRLTASGWATGTGPANRLAGVDTKFLLFTLRLDLCLLEPRLSQLVSFPLCAGIEGGLMQAEIPPRPQTRMAWIVGGLTPRVRLTHGPTFLEIGPKLDALLYPKRFISSQQGDGLPKTRSELTHQFPTVGFAVLASFGLGFP